MKLEHVVPQVPINGQLEVEQVDFTRLSWIILDEQVIQLVWDPSVQVEQEELHGSHTEVV